MISLRVNETNVSGTENISVPTPFGFNTPTNTFSQVLAMVRQLAPMHADATDAGRLFLAETSLDRHQRLKLGEFWTERVTRCGVGCVSLWKGP